MEGDEKTSFQPSPATVLTPYQRLTNALQTDPRCAQEVIFHTLIYIFILLHIKCVTPYNMLQILICIHYGITHFANKSKTQLNTHDKCRQWPSKCNERFSINSSC